MNDNEQIFKLESRELDAEIAKLNPPVNKMVKPACTAVVRKCAYKHGCRTGEIFLDQENGCPGRDWDYFWVWEYPVSVYGPRSYPSGGHVVIDSVPEYSEDLNLLLKVEEALIEQLALKEVGEGANTLDSVCAKIKVKDRLVLCLLCAIKGKYDTGQYATAYTLETIRDLLHASATDKCRALLLLKATSV